MHELKPTICFDLDGTLVDTAPDLLSALDHALTSNGYPLANHTHIRPIIGQGAKAMLYRAFQDFNATPSETKLDQLWQNLIDHYQAHIAVNSKPYEGVEQTLKNLQSKNYPLAVCTNKPMFLTTPLLEALDLTSFFAAIKGVDSYDFKKPDPRHLTETIKAAKGSPDHALMIGDSKTDIETARNAAIPVIGVNFGYSDIPIDQLQPDRIMSSFHELEGFITELFEN